MWFDLDDGDDELGVFELANGLELVAFDGGCLVFWAWRGEAGDREWAPLVGEA
jgi:hypothetical protein